MGPKPAWLQRPDTPLPFVATICCNNSLDEILSRLPNLQGEVALHAQQQINSRVIELSLECLPAEAWTLFQSLRARLDDCDVFVQPLDARGTRLLICDMDMTIVAAETLDELAGMLGLGEQVSTITDRAMHGVLDFSAALRERIALLAGQSEQVMHDVARQVELNPGAEALLEAARAAGVHTMLISGGFTQVAEPIAQRLGFDEVHCNRLELDRGRLTGQVLEPIINAELKRQVLQQRAQELGIELAACCAIGDGANDRPMVEAAGLGIAYHAKPVLRAATSCQINATDLESAIHFMGL